MGINSLLLFFSSLLSSAITHSPFSFTLFFTLCVYILKVVYGVTFTLIKSNILKLTKNNHRSKSSTSWIFSLVRILLLHAKNTIVESF